MGEIADMILEGILCESCGVALEDDAPYAHLCAACENADDRYKKNQERYARVPKQRTKPFIFKGLRK